MKTTLLIIDDSASTRSRLVETINGHLSDCRCLEAEDGITGLKKALIAVPDLILCDLEMPGLDGFKFLSLKNARKELENSPVIILTSHTSTEEKVRGLEAGASDYIVKPFDEGELIARINIHLRLKKLQDELIRKNELLRKLSNTDALTGLYNRRFLLHNLKREVERSQRKGHPLSLVMIDLDHFKRVNDTYGHPVGDQVLVETAKLLQRGLRGYDLLSRYGGEEFCLILPDTPMKEAGDIAERFRADLCRHFIEAAEDLNVTASFGVASLRKADTSDTLIARSDEALYMAKRLGRNRVQFPPSEEESDAANRISS